MELKRAEVIDFVRKEWNGESCGVSQPANPDIRTACTTEKVQEQLDTGATMIFYMKRTDKKEAINEMTFSVLMIKVRD